MPCSNPDIPGNAQSDLDHDIDDNIIARMWSYCNPKSCITLTRIAFPKGTKGISKTPHGTALWTVTSRVEIELPDGKRRVLFLKV